MGIENKAMDIHADTYDKRELSQVKQGDCQVTEEKLLEQMKKMNLQPAKVTCEGQGTQTEEEIVKDRDESEKKGNVPQLPEIKKGEMLELIRRQMEIMGLEVPK
jgi:hypothetical protein